MFGRRKMSLVLSPLFHLLCWLLSPKLAVTMTSSSMSVGSLSSDISFTKPGCPSKCGNLTVPYPFGVGIGTNCSMNPWFDIYCDTSVDPPYMLVSTRDDFRLIDISESEVRIKIPYFASLCTRSRSNSSLTLDFSTTPYTLSDANRLTQIGCSDLAVLQGYSGQYASPVLTQNNFASGCISFCSDGDQSLNGSCPGNGCCQMSVPNGTVFLNVSISNFEDRWQNVTIVKPCSYSFLGERDSFSFEAVSDLYTPPMTILDWLYSVPVVLNWRIGNESCSQARGSSDFGCYENSFCIDAGERVRGYRCSCLVGYDGNPYLPPGCRGIDIDECKGNPCHPTGICINRPGDYKCDCASGNYGNGWSNGTGCYPNQFRLSKVFIGLISGMALLTLLSLIFMMNKFVKKRRNRKRRQKFFKQNGGLLLQQQTSLKEGSILGKTRIFTAKELEKATDRFNESRILGRGGQGTVYKGMLSDGQIVAIKKSQLVDENKSKQLVEQFINEVIILSQINHRNVIKLLGCCLETRVPLLVYEFAANGTLFDHIHGDASTEFPFSWNMRLKIAADVAGALAYLHSATSLPIFHRDIKSSNILLDEKYITKVSDFGSSKSLSSDQTHLTTQVNGTFGYIDPEYFRSSQLTEKSDVYSFGVVLVELLTGLRPILPSSKAEDDRSLVSRFLSLMEGDGVESILDSQVSQQGKQAEVFTVAKIAKRCLHLNGKKRPYMKEVAMKLEAVRATQTGSTARTNFSEDYSFHKSGSMIFGVDNSDYTWTNTSDLGTTITSSSDAHPIMFDAI